MPVVSQRVSPVIYVAASARELPAEVQLWLGRAENRAVASPHIYDMLAQLARGKRYSAIIVNIQSVDWNEMEFFDQAIRLSRNTPLFVVGTHPQRAKLEAACRRGAQMFDPLLLHEEVASRETTQPEAVAPPAPPPVRPILQEAPPSDSPTPVAKPEPSAVWPQPINVEPALPRILNAVPEASAFEELIDETTDYEPDEVGDQELFESAAEAGAEELPASEPPVIDEHVESRPAVRLAPTPMDESEDIPVIFPWSVIPNRPKRIPPSSAPSSLGTPPVPPPPPAQTPPRSAGEDSPIKSVRLTPEEIAALMADPGSRRPEEGAQS